MEPMQPPRKPGSSLQRFEIKEDSGSANEMHIQTLNISATPEVTEFELPRITKAGDGKYSVTKAKYGALAATDAERKARVGKNSRFSLNTLSRGPLSVENEEQRVIEERVNTQVQAIAEKAKAEAAALGYRDGLAKGHEEAFIKFQEEARSRLEGFEKILASAESAKSEIFRANERFLIDLVFRISRMVMLRELTTDRDYVRRLAIELIERVGVRENIKVRINPEDSETLGMLKQGIEAALGSLTNLSVEVSNQVPRGGCAVETQWNAIDASIDRALQGIADSVIGPQAVASKTEAAS